MSKRRYKCVEFKKVDWAEVGKRLVGERVVLAVDVAKEDFVATLLTADEEAVLTFGWRHPQETWEVLERLVGLGRERRLEAVLEPSGTLWRHAVMAIKASGACGVPSQSEAYPRRGGDL